MLASRRTSILLCIVSSAFCAAAALRSGRTAPPARPDVLLVFEYDGLFDWEAVRIGDAWTTSAIQWIRDLADRLTQSTANPAGQDLMVPSGPLNCSCILLFPLLMHTQLRKGNKHANCRQQFSAECHV